MSLKICGGRGAGSVPEGRLCSRMKFFSDAHNGSDMSTSSNGIFRLARTDVTKSCFRLICKTYIHTTDTTRRPASTDMTARRQFQATGQPVSRTQASDAMTSRLPRYEAKCVQCGCFQCGSVLCIETSRNGATPCQYIYTTRKAIDCATTVPLRAFI